MESEFAALAALLGHDAARLAAGEEITSYLTVANAHDARRVFSRASPAQRSARQASFYQPAIAARARLGQGLHDRGEAFAFADEPLDPADRHALERHFPAHVKAISVAEKRLAPGERWDVSVRGAAWGIDDMEELYVVVNVGRLVLGPGAEVLVRGNVLSLFCEELVSEGAGGAVPRIAVLPTPFSLDGRRGAAHDGGHGSPGTPGTRGRDAEPLATEPTMIGPRLRAPLDRALLDGSDGTAGTAGGRGGDGRNGGMCKLAEITVRALAGELAVFAQAGRGGDGGDGGDGGEGGGGGCGADGVTVVGGIVQPGRSGDGGRGGAGGRGGNAGHGGVSSNVYVSVPAEAESRVRCIALASEGGSAGRGGRGGRGGAAGETPRPGRNAPPASEHARHGEPGTDGAPGVTGRGRPAPVIFLNERPHGGSDLDPATTQERLVL